MGDSLHEKLRVIGLREKIQAIVEKAAVAATVADWDQAAMEIAALMPIEEYAEILAMALEAAHREGYHDGYGHGVSAASR